MTAFLSAVREVVGIVLCIIGCVGFLAMAVWMLWVTFKGRKK